MTFARAWLLFWLAVAAPWAVIALWHAAAWRPVAVALVVAIGGAWWFR